MFKAESPHFFMAPTKGIKGHSQVNLNISIIIISQY